MQQYRLIILYILLLILVGCSNQNGVTAKNEKEPKKSTFSITDFADRTIEFETTPEKIVALSHGDVDIIYALGNEVVGRPSGETSVEEAKKALEVGSTHSMDVEKITSLEPDVVLGNHPMNMKDVQAIENMGADMVLSHANSVKDIQEQIALFGQLLHKENEAQQLINMIDDKLTAIQQSKVEKKPRVLLVYGAPGTNMVALPNSLGGNILELAGGLNIASDYPSLEMYPQYAQLNAERIIEANPQVILIMTHGDPEKVKNSLVKDMSQTAGWDELEAVKNNRVLILPSDLFGTNPGTKVIDALDYLHELIKDVKNE
jgi:iron complex transport system substrate-binding protein